MEFILLVQKIFNILAKRLRLLILAYYATEKLKIEKQKAINKLRPPTNGMVVRRLNV